MNAWIAFWSILKKDIKTYYLKPPNISWGIIFPLSWTLMQLVRTPGGAVSVDIPALLPGLMGMSVLFGSTSMLAVTITFERKGRSFDRLLLAPVSLTTLILAKISGAVIFGAGIALLPALVSVFLTDLSGVQWGAVIVGLFAMALSSALMGLVIAISAKEVFEAQTYSNFFRFPMLFLTGLFIPVQSLPMFLRPVSYCLPITYGADLLTRAVLHTGELPMGVSFGILIAFSALLFWLCLRNIRRKWIL